MIKARQLGALLLFAHVSFAQTVTNIPTAPVVTDLSVARQDTEVRINVSATAAVTSAKVTAAYGDRIAIDMPGVVYSMTPRRILVRKNGVYAVRIWQQSENPPLTRVLIELDRAIPYLLSSEGNSVVVRIGARLQEQTQRASKAPPQPARRQDAPAHTGRSPPAVSAAEAVIGVFRKSQKTSQSSGSESVPPVQQAAAQSLPPIVVSQTQEPAPSQSLPPIVVSQAQGPTATTVDSSRQPNPSVTAQNAAPKPTEEPKAAPPAPNLTANNLPPAPPSLRPSTVTPAAAEPKAAESKAPVVSAPPASGVAATSSSPPPASNPEPSTPVTAALPSEPPAPSSAAVEVSKPAGGLSEVDMRALTESVNTGMRTAFQVKYVQEGTAYLDGGRSSGLSEGMNLVIKDENKPAAEDGTGGSTGGPAAELVVIGVAETSAVTEIRTPKRDVVPGDIAFLSTQDTQALVDQHTVGATRKYPAVITFTENDLLDEEARAYVPRPPLPSVNRARGRFGIDYMGTINRDSSQSRSSEVGAVFRADITRIGGTYWNLSGYWRGRINSFSASTQPTLQDLLNRTYHLEMTYQNPGSRWVAGVGRMYLPWASSLNTIDGGYFGSRFGKVATIGIFGGSTPDPTSWNYSLDQRLGGAFVNFEGGSFDNTHYTSTSGIGVSTLKWQVQKPFIFFENTISYKRFFSIYHSLQADRPRGNSVVASPGAGISQSFLTVRVSPVERIEFSFSHTFFRDIPTFDATLVATGLLDKYLFQGISAGVNVKVVKQITLYSDLGQSSRTGDPTRSLNQLYGVTFGRVPWVGLRTDVHYSKFNSSFGGGTYRAVSISRNFGDEFQLNVLGGDQSITSTLAGNQSARFFTSTLDTSLGSRFFLQGGLTFYRGQLQNYDQWFFTLGYRFDSRMKPR